jgi:hypothetical protein
LKDQPLLFLKANTISDAINTRSCLFAALLMLLAALPACTLFETGSAPQRDLPAAASGLQNLFNPSSQLIASVEVHSIIIHKRETPVSAPFLELGSDDQLRLRFETIGSESRQFRVTFTHHNPDWSRSPLPPEMFLEGFATQNISGGELSTPCRPCYRRFTFDFPGRDFGFRFSGNYMIRIEDAVTGNLMFTMPFFVHENQGSIRSSVETTITPRRDLRIAHRPVSRYAYPDIVDQPQFDLEFYYVQNRFWGRAVQADELDFSSPAEARFETGNRGHFIGDYEFRYLDLTTLSQTNPQIYSFDPTEIPPLVILIDDPEGFSPIAAPSGAGRTGRPDTGLNTEYANVIFRFAPAEELPAHDAIYVTGDFNNWTIQPGKRMQYLDDIGRWQGSAMIKQGLYHYKFVKVDDYRVLDLEFDDLFRNTRQEYHAFVYMRDPVRNIYRLLQMNHFFAGP